MKEIVIVGAGGLGKEVAFILRRIGEHQLVGFIDDNQEKQGKLVVGLPVIGTLSCLQAWEEPLAVVLAIANGTQREKIAKQLKTNPMFTFPTIQDPSVLVGFNVSVGEGNIIMPHVTMTGDIEINDFNVIELKCAIGHDVEIGSYNTLFPDCLLAGYVKVHQYVSLGMGTQVIQNIQIANQVITGAGTVVIRDLAKDSKAVGVPAKVI